MLAGGDFDVMFVEGGADGGVAEDVIGRGGFFDEERLEGSQVCKISLCFWNRPDLLQ